MKKAIVLLCLFYTILSTAFAQKPPQVKNFTSQVELCYCVGTPSNYHVKMRWDLIPKVTRYFVYRVGQGVTPNYNRPYAKLTNNESMFIDRAVKYQDKWNYYRDWETDRKSTRLNSSHSAKSRMPSSA